MLLSILLIVLFIVIFVSFFFFYEQHESKLIKSKDDEVTSNRIACGEIWTGMTLSQFTDVVPNCIQVKDENGRLFYQMVDDSNSVRFFFNDDYKLDFIKV